MAFKSIKQYNEERFGELFVLRNDKEFADVIFMYRNIDDVLVADTHYIKSADYSGYVHCTGRGCPACAKGIRVQTKLFIPLYNITEHELQIWDRSTQFENQLNYDVFSKFPNPCEYVFRITRHGVARDVNTTYEIQAVGKNTFMHYDDILKKCNTSFPEFYSEKCREYSAGELNMLLNAPASSSEFDGDMPNYTVTPRASFKATVTPAVVPATPFDAPIVEPVNISAIEPMSVAPVEDPSSSIIATNDYSILNDGLASKIIEPYTDDDVDF